jgi:flagellar biosynthetic protein FliQ
VNQDVAINVVVQALEVGLKVALPMLLVGLVIGLAVSVFQAVTQIQEQTLSFIPKIAGLVVVILVAGPWMLGTLLAWTEQLYTSIPSLVGGAGR